HAAKRSPADGRPRGAETHLVVVQRPVGVGVSALVSTAAPAKAGTASRRHRKRCLGSWSFIGPVGRRRLSVGQHGRTGKSRHGLQAASQAMPWLVVVVRAALKEASE